MEQVNPIKRKINLEGNLNTRDIGGYPVSKNERIRWGKLVRADSMDQLTSNDQQQLLAYGVKCIIDIRDPFELEKSPNVFSGDTDLHYVNIPILGDPQVSEALGKASDLTAKYVVTLELCQPQIRSILETFIKSADGCTIIHCSAGKDRTGLLIALLLAAVGVSKDIILEDYAISEIYLAPKIEHWLSGAKTEAAKQNILANMTSSPEVLEGALTHLDQQYGGVLQYLERIGIAQQQIHSISSKLVEHIPE
ncbi:tyrosine-protein phosphatase [Paenibacillus koleovorans]|uniref:tyrosine-protein phosphatase n=1 Tax=Paenibacillus koleovorans TaxID=121608 RepID=UPI0013E37B3F|nr:tyrosine-protein phosphatase [Paenibacillus koleovorans]